MVIPLSSHLDVTSFILYPFLFYLILSNVARLILKLNYIGEIITRVPQNQEKDVELMRY